MPTVIERISSVGTGGLEQQLSSQVGALQQVISLAGPLVEGKTPDITALVGRLGALRSPSFEGGGFGASLSSALALAPADLSSVVGPIGGRFAEMSTLVDAELKPLIENAVNGARGIQQLLNVRLSCLQGIGGVGSSPAPADPAAAADPAAPAQPAPPSRIALAAQHVAQLDSVLGKLPDNIDAASLVQLLLALAGSKPRDRFIAINLPVLDDFVDPLQTLAIWAALDVDGIRAHMTTSVDALTARVRECATQPVAELAAGLGLFSTGLRATALSSAADDLAQKLGALDEALRGNDAVATSLAQQALDAAIDAYAALATTMAGDALPAARALRQLPALQPARLVDDLEHLAMLVEPSNLASTLSVAIPAVSPIPTEAIDAFKDGVQPLIDWLNELMGLLNFGGAQAGVAQVASKARELANDIESGLTGVTLEVQAAFAGVSDAIDGLGLDALRAQLSAQIQTFGEQLRREVVQAFEPARDATHQAIDVVSQTLNAFDPSSIVAALQQVVDGVAAVLSGDDVKGAIEQVKQAVDTVAEALRSLSFQPVTDEVVGLINQMKNGLQAIIEKELNEATKSALGAAMSILPGDLHPVTDPLLADFGNLIENGPLVVLQSVKDAPKRLLDQIQQFNPAALIGDQLSGPYRELLARADDFEASKLFAAADAELERARRRLLESARPSRALDPLRAPVQQLFGKLDAFSAAALLAPLTDKLEETVDQIIEASPVDEVLAAVNGVFAAVRDVLSFLERIQSVASRVERLFTAFARADVELDAWRDRVLASVPSVGGSLAPAVAGLNGAIDAVRHVDVLAAFDAATAGVVGQLDQLDPAARLTRIVTAYARLVPRVAALPPLSSARTAAEQSLQRFNPTQPQHSAPLRAAADVRAQLTAARGELVASAAAWGSAAEDLALLHVENGADLRALLAGAVDVALRPVRFVFASLASMAGMVSGITSTLAELVTALTSRLNALVNGPESLSAISDAVQQVVDALRGINLSFVGQSLDQVLGTVRDKLRLLDPARLATDLDSAFEQALSSLSLSTIIPAQDLAALDAAWQSVVDKLRTLDPGKLLEGAVQPIYDAAITPLLDAFDLTPIFDALLEFFDSLEGELGTGLDEVNAAYQSLIALRPGGGGASLSLGG